METNYLNLIIQLLLVITLVVITFLLSRLSKSLKKEKRLTRFAIDALSDKPISFFDKVQKIYYGLVKKVTNSLKKSNLFKNYSKKYEIFVDQTEIIRKDPMDFISNKIIISFLAIIITIVSDVLRLHSINVLQLLFAMLVGFFIPDVFLKIEEKRRKIRIEEDVLKAVIIMNNAFKSGRSIMQAVELVSQEITGPIADEFKKIYIDLTYGLDLEVVFKRFSERVELEDVKYMASSLVILNKTGGDIVEVFSSIEKGFFDRKKLKDELKSTTALSRLVYKMLVAMPFLIFIVIYILNPTYFTPLVETLPGKVLSVVILSIYLLYIIIVKRIIDVKDL